MYQLITNGGCMYRIVIVVCISLWTLIVYSQEQGKYELLYEQVLSPAAAQGLSIAIASDESGHDPDLPIVSPLISPPLTSPLQALPLTPAAPTGESPLFAGSPTSEECEPFVSPLAQNYAVHKRVQSFCDLDIRTISSASVVQRERQPLTRRGWCCIAGSCAGVWIVAGTVLYFIHKYTHAF